MLARYGRLEGLTATAPREAAQTALLDLVQLRTRYVNERTAYGKLAAELESGEARRQALDRRVTTLNATLEIVLAADPAFCSGGPKSCARSRVSDRPTPPAWSRPCPSWAASTGARPRLCPAWLPAPTTAASTRGSGACAAAAAPRGSCWIWQRSRRSAGTPPCGPSTSGCGPGQGSQSGLGGRDAQTDRPGQRPLADRSPVAGRAPAQALP